MRYLGIDIGGTEIKHGLYDELGNSLVHDPRPIKSVRDNFEEILDIIDTIVSKYSDLDGIGLSIPGAVNTDSGIIIEGGAIPTLSNKYLGEIIEQRTGIRTVLENDANCATLAEHWTGNGVGSSNLVCITIGSGIGGGIIINNQLYHGSNFMAGEFGYMITKEFSNYTDYEIMSENSATEALVYKVSKLFGISDGQFSGRNVFELLSSENEPLLQIYDEWIRCLSTGIYNIAFSIDPDTILLGGGVSASSKLIQDVKSALQKMTPYYKIWNIDVCKHHNDAGKIGAAYYCMKTEEKQ